ncbi:MAG: hypothetical protein LBJ47_04930 [Tannerella sp.]|jgi:hypothetical protein|nr:hypothetical protein [Tannerella sp.]
MAKRRDLKKTIEYLSGELITQTLLYSLRPEAERKKIGQIIARICDMNDEYRRRTGSPSAQADRKSTRRYYAKLREDVNTEADRIYGELMLLNKENSRN